MFDGQLPPTAVLVDARNIAEQLPRIKAALQVVDFAGVDLETHDDDRHNGLNVLCNYDPVTRKKSGKKLAFDMKRITLCGCSFWPEGSDTVWYLNFNHADVENRLPLSVLREVIDSKPKNSVWLAHNASFELTVLLNDKYAIQLDPIICTLQLAVSAYGPDEFDIGKFTAKPLGSLFAKVGDLRREAAGWDFEAKAKMPSSLEEIVGSITGKEATGAASYNGWIDEIAYGYGLKKAIKSWFGYEMTTFAQCLGDKAHMGCLTGEEVAAYGCDDAYWCVRLFRKLIEYIKPETLKAFIDQENPMVEVFSEIWRGGMKVNTPAIIARRDIERVNFANHLRALKSTLRSMLPYAAEPHEKLLEREKWYEKSYVKHRQRIAAFAFSPDSTDDYEQVSQVASSVGTAWDQEKGAKKRKTGVLLNPTYWQQVRMMIYDLGQAQLIFSKGDVQSNGEARGKIKDRTDSPYLVQLIDCINAMASVEQRIKLYITPYLLLTDPETAKMYPVISSMQAARRMGAENPNSMQLAKRGESVYVRGFFEGDFKEHLMVSLDWSAIELVIIGELSKDPEFAKCYSTLPHADLHAGAAADILAVEVEGLTEEMFRSLRRIESMEEFIETNRLDPKQAERLFLNLKGEKLKLEKIYGYWRTEIGKGANFNYWYSGFLATIGERMGWSMDKTGRATERYRGRFSVAEAWRQGKIRELQETGALSLPDGHRRTRYEATMAWRIGFVNKFPRIDSEPAFNRVVWEIANRIGRRAGNQGINALVQGTCSTIAKRSILRIRQRIKEFKARFLMPCHDELVFSVHHREVVEFIHMARGIMIDHPDLFPTLALDASPSVGITYEPWTAKAKMGQVELFEPPAEIVGVDWAGKRLNDDGVREVVSHLMALRGAA